MKRAARLAIVIFVLVFLAFPGHVFAYLHPVHSRFLQRDPAGYMDGPSNYQYVQSKPLAYADPMGLQAQPATQPGDCVCGPDVTDWFYKDLLKHLEATKREAQLPSPLRLAKFNKRAAGGLAYKWMTFDASRPGCGTGVCKHTVELAGLCIRKNQLGNIAFIVLGTLFPPGGPWDAPESLAKYVYTNEHGGGTYATDHPHAKDYGEYAGKPRKDNLAAFGVGNALATHMDTAQEFRDSLSKAMADPEVLSKYGSLYPGGAQLVPGDLTFAPEHGGIDTSKCKRCPQPLRDPGYSGEAIDPIFDKFSAQQFRNPTYTELNTPGAVKAINDPEAYLRLYYEDYAH